MARVRNAMAFGIHQFFQQRGFLYIQTPIITASDAEGAGAMFRVTTLDVNDPPRLDGGRRRLRRRQPGLLRTPRLPHRQWAAGSRNIRPVHDRRLHLWPYLPAPKTPTPPATWPSSGWWSRRWPSAIWTAWRIWPRISSATSWPTPWRPAPTTWHFSTVSTTRS